MEIEDVLSLGTEVGAALVAISGLIATLNLQNNREIEKPVFNLLIMVLITSGCLTVFSYAPLVLHPLFSSDESMWRFWNGLSALIQGPTLVFGIYNVHKKLMAIPNTLAIPILTTGTVVQYFLIMSALNLTTGLDHGFIFTCILLQIVAATVIFFSGYIIQLSRSKIQELSA